MTVAIILGLLLCQAAQTMYFYSKLKNVKPTEAAPTPTPAAPPVDVLPGSIRSTFSVLYGNP